MFNDFSETNYLRICWFDFHKIYRIKAFWVEMIDLDLFLDILRDIAMATNFLEKKLANSPVSSLLSFRNGTGYHYFNVRINSANNACISCENFVKFGPITPELTELICECLVRHG